MATMLSDKGIPMHWTTIAKIEKNDRSVRIDEAAGIATSSARPSTSCWAARLHQNTKTASSAKSD
jgi:hypothetical protein